MENLIDTVMNIWIFAFIGLMIWLYCREESDTEEKETSRQPDEV